MDLKIFTPKFIEETPPDELSKLRKQLIQHVKAASALELVLRAELIQNNENKDADAAVKKMAPERRAALALALKGDEA